MAARNFTNPRCLVREQIELVGSFATNGAGAVAATSQKGLGFSVARTGVGTADITFTDKYNDLIAAHVELQLNALTNAQVQIGAYDPATKKLSIRYIAAGIAAEWPAANANNRVHFRVAFRNSATAPSYGA